MGLSTFANPIPALYLPDIPEPLVTEAAAALRPMTMKVVADISAALVTNWPKSVYAGYMAFVRCTLDNTVGIDSQGMMLSNVGADGPLSQWTPVAAIFSET